MRWSLGARDSYHLDLYQWLRVLHRGQARSHSASRVHCYGGRQLAGDGIGPVIQFDLHRWQASSHSSTSCTVAAQVTGLMPHQPVLVRAGQGPDAEQDYQ